ncbi:hypothetical protein LCGC14_3029760, partial [marine sediment metagenome]
MKRRSFFTAALAFVTAPLALLRKTEASSVLSEENFTYHGTNWYPPEPRDTKASVTIRAPYMSLGSSVVFEVFW